MRALIEVMSTGEAFDGEYLADRKFYGKVDRAAGYYVVMWDGPENKPPVFGSDRKPNLDVQWDGPYTLDEAKIVLGVDDAPAPLAPTPALSPAEAVLGFVVWLCGRQGEMAVGVGHDSQPVLDRVKEFCKANGLASPREGWAATVVLPEAGKDGDTKDA